MNQKLWVRPMSTCFPLWDLGSISAVETEVYGLPDPDQLHSWTSLINSEPLLKTLVVLDNTRIIGFLVAMITGKNVDILNMAVIPSHRRQGAGSLLLDYLIKQQFGGADQVIELAINETLLGELNFFKQNGFRAIEILWKFHGEDDAYHMLYQPGEVQPAVASHAEGASS